VKVISQCNARSSKELLPILLRFKHKKKQWDSSTINDFLIVTKPIVYCGLLKKQNEPRKYKARSHSEFVLSK
jgi:hypothetical protein